MDTPPIHISRWNLSSLEKLGEEFGWRIMDHHIQPIRCTEKVKKPIFELELIALFKSYKWADREGEKMHETLVTLEELMKAEEYEDYTSENNIQLITSLEEIRTILK